MRCRRCSRDHFASYFCHCSDKSDQGERQLSWRENPSEIFFVFTKLTEYGKRCIKDNLDMFKEGTEDLNNDENIYEAIHTGGVD